MTVLKAKIPALCSLLLMALVFFPGSEGKTCTEVSRTYTPLLCGEDTCVNHCHREGFTGGKCVITSFDPPPPPPFQSASARNLADDACGKGNISFVCLMY
ncbi:hypothetical protein ZWY2020_029800 [Hordeum vulgare]|nr:hypothetical protein ZWY2020_029800 [Hordeum vulgare]